MAQINTKIITRNDSIENWEANKTVVLMKGEQAVAFFDDGSSRVKVGDGVTTWELLPWVGAEEAKHFEVVKNDGETDEAAIVRAVNGRDVNAGDTAVVKTLIASGKYMYTGYVHNGTTWAAMDGNYNAENVYFDEDMLFTYAFGKYKLSNGNVTIPAAGKNLKELLMAAHVDIINPTKTAPSFSLSASSNVSKEVGDTYAMPTATATFTDGTYTYGYVDAEGKETNGTNTKAGITASTIDITCDKTSDEKNATNVNSATLTLTEANLNSESMKGLVVTDESIQYTFTAECAYPASTRTPTNNVGETSNSETGAEYTPQAAGDWEVADGTAKTATCTISGYRKMFMGTISDNSKTIDSALIRGLSLVSTQASKTAQTFTVPVGATKIIVAFPSTYSTVDPKFEYFTMSWEDFGGFVNAGTVRVADKRGGENGLMDYTVYTFTHASPSGFEADTQYRVTLK